MPIKWSTVKVSEAMDEVEAQVILADQFIAEVKVKAKEAKKIANLPQYIDQPRRTLSDRLGYSLESFLGYINRIRERIPAGTIEAERESTKHGSTQSLM